MVLEKALKILEIEAMTFLRPAKSLEAVKHSKKVLETGTEPIVTKKVLHELREDQILMIDELARINGLKKIDIVRGIFDEWRNAVIEGQLAQ